MTLPMFPTGPLVDVKPTSLRPYQAKCVSRLRTHVVMGKRRILVVAPTGAGKMYCVAYIIKTATVPVLFICHRMELIDQCASELRRQGLSHIGVIRADDERTDTSASIQVSSIQSLIRREKPKAGIVIIDEAHRAMGDSYQSIAEYYKDSILLGFTATPTRLDGKPLGSTFELLEVSATYTELLKNKSWLVAPDCYSSWASADLSSVRTIGGDYDEGQLGEVMRHLSGNVVEHWLRLADKHPVFMNGQRVPQKTTAGDRRRTIVFAVNIEHSKDITASFIAAGVRATHLDGTTPEEERREILSKLADGTLEVVVNCNVLLEGTDIPSVKCVVHARPTKSLVLWKQSAGRLMRPWNDVVPLLLDHAGNFDRHGPPHEDYEWSLTSGAIRKNLAPAKLCKKCFAYVAAGLVLCPHCGWEFPKAAPKPITESKTELVLRDDEKTRETFFSSMSALARQRGYKPGFAAAKYKERYGIWPPWAWSEGLRGIAASDERWKEAMARRERHKKRDEEEAKAWDLGGEDDSPEKDEEETFYGWLEEEGIV